MGMKRNEDMLPFLPTTSTVVESSNSSVCKNVSKHSYPFTIIIYLIYIIRVGYLRPYVFPAIL